MQELVKAGSTGVLRELILRNATTGQGVTGIAAASVLCAFMRQGASGSVSVPLVSGTLGTWASGSWTEVNSTACPGLYQVGLPDACFAPGATDVKVIFQYSGALERVLEFQLTGADLSNGVNLGLADIDTNISSRSTYAGTDTPGTVTLLSTIGASGSGLTNLGDARIGSIYSNTQSILSVNAATSGLFQRILSLVGDNQGVPSGSVTLDANSNPLSYVICGYDTAAHAALNDGVTGVINKVQVQNTYNSAGWSSTTITRIT